MRFRQLSSCPLKHFPAILCTPNTPRHQQRPCWMPWTRSC